MATESELPDRHKQTKGRAPMAKRRSSQRECATTTAAATTVKQASKQAAPVTLCSSATALSPVLSLLLGSRYAIPASGQLRSRQSGSDSGSIGHS